jgi:hypothetical protein
LSSKPLRYSIIPPFLNNTACFPSSIALHTIAHSFNAAAEMKFESNVLSSDDIDVSFFLYSKFDEGDVDDALGDDVEDVAAAPAPDITIVLGDILFSDRVKGEENI